MTEDANIATFVRWFQSNGGYIDTEAMGITEFPDSGRGGVALRDIPEGHTLFTLPRTMILSTRTSPLPSLFGYDAWCTYGLNKGWVGLILCMMWEDAWAHESDGMFGDGKGQDQSNIQIQWGPYLRTLPTTFDTPMFWSAEELEELRGTTVVDKIGREDAERTYFEHLVPATKISPTLFPPSHHEKWYTLDAYHRAGSRILSRSFTVTHWRDADVNDEDHNDEVRDVESDADEAENRHGVESPMRVDDELHLGDSTGQDSDSEDDGDDPSNVAMVPMADILNARWGSENAKLFHEPLVLRMVTTKEIKQGEQIFNTYGDLPNSDLLRRYGHVDIVRLPSPPNPTSDRNGDVEMEDSRNVESISHFGNPSDIAEIRADLIVDTIQRSDLVSKGKDMRARIEWWLDEGEEDAFVLGLPKSGSDLSGIFPPAFVSLTRLLILSEHDFGSARSKGKIPKGSLKKAGAEETKQVLTILDEVMKQREGMYIGGSVEDDEHLLSIPGEMNKRKRHATIVRLGEKRILRDARRALRRIFAECGTPTSEAGRRNRKDDMKKEKVRGETEMSRKRGITGAVEDCGWKKARK